MNNIARSILIILLYFPSFLFASEKLIFSIDIVRHGDRTPIQSIPTVNYQWKEGLGQLTAEGMQQEYEVGRQLRKRYIEQTHLLPEHYESGTLYARSTDYERTLMSAQSLLMGLYPLGTGPNVATEKPALPYAFQPIPIFSAPFNHDEIINQHVKSSERYKLMQHYVYSTHEWQQKNNALKANYPRWSRLTGIPIKNLQDVEVVGDALYVHKIHHIPMPEGLSKNDIDTIIKEGNWVFITQEKPLPVARIYSKKLMNNIANYLKNASLKSSKLKYVLFSGHDDTIASTLIYMGTKIDTTPPYTSQLNFSLYEEYPNQYFVKITYNNNLVYIPACGSSTCDLQKFLNAVK